MEGKCFTSLIGGEAGYGVMSAGAMIAKAATRGGLWAFVVNEYPSLIKGGLNNCLTRISCDKLTAYEERADFLGAVSQQALDQNISLLKPGAAVLYDQDTITVSPEQGAGLNLFPVKLLQTLKGDAAKVMVNSSLLGAFCALTGFPAAAIRQVMAGEFKSEKLREENLSLFNAALAQTTARYPGPREFPLAMPGVTPRRMLLTGNDAICMGAIKAGCKFSAGYPMTPASSVLTYMADHGANYKVVFKQAEDEIAAINMLIGAGFAGVRSLGATSGGGFALMVEALGFAAQAEIPLVIVEAQRGGPSTGLPTRTAQGDLGFVTHSSPSEFPRLVVAPGDVEECFYETFRVFDLAYKYQLPAIILTDKYLADSQVTQDEFDTRNMIPADNAVDEAWLAQHQPYRRYEQTPTGISLRAIPGQKGGRHIATSYTHGVDGFYSSGNHEFAGDEPEITAQGLDKLFRKLPYLLDEVQGIKRYGLPEADLTVIGWGSTKGAILEALQLAQTKGLSVNFLQVLYMAPFPGREMSEALAGARRTLLVEGNKTGQLGALIAENTGYIIQNKYLKYDSRPFTPSGILAKIEEVLA